jgi:hypothetical protein
VGTYTHSHTLTHIHTHTHTLTHHTHAHTLTHTHTHTPHTHYTLHALHALYRQKIPGTYVIQALGPIVDNVYSWTIVSDVAKSSVWVTARNPSTFEESGEAAIALAKAQDLGFDMLFNNPIKSAQPVDCVYVPAEVVKKEKKDEEG